MSRGKKIHAFPGIKTECSVDHYWPRAAIKNLVTRRLGEDIFNLIDRSNQRTLLLSATVVSLEGGIFILSDGTPNNFVHYCLSTTHRHALTFSKKPHHSVVCRSKLKATSYEYFKKQLINFKTVRDLEPEYYDMSKYVAAKDMTVSIIMLVKDAATYIPFISYIFDVIKKKTTLETEFFILENDSTDMSEEMLKKFMVGKKGKLFSGKLDWDADERSGTNIKRGAYMARLRNELKNKHGKLTSNYTVVIDTDVYFDHTVIEKLIGKLEPGVVMSTSYGKAWDIMLSHSSDHYYDTFAYITEDGLGFKETGNKCLFHGCELCSKYLEPRGLMKKRYPKDVDVIKVKSAFGGLVVLPTEIYNNTNWTPTPCEHHGWCEQLRKHGDIIVSRNIETIIAKPRHNLLDRSNIISLLCGE